MKKRLKNGRKKTNKAQTFDERFSGWRKTVCAKCDHHEYHENNSMYYFPEHRCNNKLFTKVDPITGNRYPVDCKKYNDGNCAGFTPKKPVKKKKGFWKTFFLALLD